MKYVGSSDEELTGGNVVVVGSLPRPYKFKLILSFGDGVGSPVSLNVRLSFVDVLGSRGDGGDASRIVISIFARVGFGLGSDVVGAGVVGAGV